MITCVVIILGTLVLLERGYISINRAVLRLVGVAANEQEPKTKHRRRKLSVPPVLIAELRRHKAVQARQQLRAGAAYQDAGWLFADALGRVLKPDGVSHKFRRLADAAGYSEITIKGLRHTHASFIHKQGVKAAQYGSATARPAPP